MRYDDRLATVLRLPVGGAAFARIQWRKLVDLLGTAPAEARGDILDAAHVRLADLARELPASTRTAILSDPGLRLRSPRLVAALASGEPQVARAALTAAQLSEEQWRDLVPALPASARVQLAARRDLPTSTRELLGRLGATGLHLPGEAPPPRAPEPVPAAKPAPQPTAQPAPEPAAEITGIGAIVQRIEAFRRAREETGPVRLGAKASAIAPRLPLGEDAPSPLTHFDFATDAAGRIVWAEGRFAPMLVGMALASHDGLAAPIARHQPIRAATLTLAGAEAIAGPWRIDAAPRFDPVGGRFAGHVGRARRLGEVAASPSPAGESDRLRQMLHELRTPVNAIQGFAEIIQQQLFGHTPHEYRALAAAIAADAAHMLAGFEELERYARLDTGAMVPTAGASDLAVCLAATIAQLTPHTAPRQAGFVLEHVGEKSAHMVALAPSETERLCWRLLATLAAHMAPGEVLPLFVSRETCAEELVLRLPGALAALDDEALFHAAASAQRAAPSAGMFGTGFALRLVATEAHAATGTLRRKDEWLCLSLPSAMDSAKTTPDLTNSPAQHSAEPQGAMGAAAGPAG